MTRKDPIIAIDDQDEIPLHCSKEEVDTAVTVAIAYLKDGYDVIVGFELDLITGTIVKVESENQEPGYHFFFVIMQLHDGTVVKDELQLPAISYPMRKDIEQVRFTGPNAKPRMLRTKDRPTMQ